MKLENINDQLMVMAAHRYCLGRRSYIVGACIQWAVETWEQMEENTQNVLLRDTAEALMDNCAGSSCDIKEWKMLLQWGMEQVTERQKRWIIEAVAHHDEPFPITLT